MKLLKPLPRKGIEHKELSFKHEGREYCVVIQVTSSKLKSAEDRGKHSMGVKLNSATMYDMTAFRGNK